MTQIEKKLTVIINTKNAASTLAATLKSVEFADKVLVMDMDSSDETAQIARAYGAKVVFHPEVGIVEPARNKALAMVKSGWVLVLDSDETLSSDLAKKIKSMVGGDAIATGYYIPRKNFIFGDWLNTAGWWPDYQLRFFQAGTVTWPNEIHGKPECSGSVDYLAANEILAINHQNYPTVSSYLSKLDRYTDHELTARKPVSTHDEQSIVQAWSGELMSRLFAQAGLKAGVRGVGMGLLQANYELVVALKQWQKLEKARSATQNITEVQDGSLGWHALAGHRSDLAYWLADWQVSRQRGLAKFYWQVRRKLKL